MGEKREKKKYYSGPVRKRRHDLDLRDYIVSIHTYYVRCFKRVVSLNLP